MSFGCGSLLDEDGDEQEAACHIVGVEMVRLPGPWDGDGGEAVALVELDSEVSYGPNSFELGRAIAERLSPVGWEYRPGQLAWLDVAGVEVDADNVGRVAIYPARSDVI